MPKSPVLTDSAKRRSTRPKKLKNESFTDDLPDDVIDKVMKGAKEEVKMPAGWNPSDDSEDEYNPSKDKKISNKARNSIPDSDSEDEIRQPKKSRRGPASKVGSSPAQFKVIKSSPIRVQHPSPMINNFNKMDQGDGMDKVHSCLICTAKDGKNLNLGSGMADLKYHYAVCYYDDNGANKFFPWVDPGEDNKIDDGVIEHFGQRFKYKCPFDGCAKNKARKKDMGYKEYCIHLGVAHNLLEKVIEYDLEERPSLEEVLEVLTKQRQGVEIVDIPPVQMEEVHTCLLCGGKDKNSGKIDKEASNLSISKESLWKTRYHYASCFYDTDVYLYKYPPGEDNTNDEGEVIDVVGRTTQYTCREKKCSVKRKMGYKEFCIHNANDHGGLEEVLGEHEEEKVRDLLDKLRK